MDGVGLWFVLSIVLLACFWKIASVDYGAYEGDLDAKTDSGKSELFKVLEIFDGDTFNVWMNGRKVTIRLGGVDCPENGQPWGNTARAGLVKLIGGKKVRLEPIEKDKYGRLVASVFLAGS